MRGVLRQLKERLGPRLEEAVVLHTGEHAYKHDDWITVLPLDQLRAPVGKPDTTVKMTY